MPRLRGRPKGYPKTGGRVAGTPNKVTKPIKEIAGQFTEAAVATLAAIMTDPLAPHAARVAAAGQLLDRGHGRPHQTSDITTHEGQSYVRAPSKASYEDWKRYSQDKQADSETKARELRATNQPKIEAKPNGNQKPLPN